MCRIHRSSPRAAPGRAIGTLLLGLAVLTAVLLPRAAGTLTPGTAVAAAIPPAPSIGDCISRFDPNGGQSIDPSATGQAAAGPASSATRASGDAAVPSAVIGSCRGPIAGEVLSVQPRGLAVDQLSPAAYDDASATCAHGIDAYLGAPPGLNAGSASAPGLTDWLPAARYTTVLVGPDALQRGAGRVWSACVVTSVAASTYGGPIRAGFTTGHLDPAFGYCVGSTDLSDWVPCGAVHVGQVLAWGTPRAGVALSRPPLRADCLAAATALMGTADPSKSGALQVGLIGYEGAGSVQACGVRVEGGQHLTGSVIGIGGAPLRLTG